MESRDLPRWDNWCASQLKIVLLGGRNSGKNMLGNLILGKEEFVTKERTSCSRRLGVVAGRWVTVVDTPGWWCDFSCQETSNLVKREILTSVSLCWPGPHVFLITVKARSAFSERRRKAVEEHVSLLGDKVWSHCMVVFTCTDKSERSVEREGKPLQWLADKCNQRSHRVVFNNATNVRELLVKIQELVRENGNKVFEMEEKLSQKVAEEKREADERARLRFIRMKQNRSLMRESSKPATSIRMVLLGAKGSGKTSALRTILCRETSHQFQRTAQCQVEEGVVFGRQVTVVDTPGWWMNYYCHETSLFDQKEIGLSPSLCPPGPHVFLLVIRVDRAFRRTYLTAITEHLELLGKNIWSRVMLLFSFGDWLAGTMTEQFIESEGEPLRWLVEKCCNRYHVLNSRTRGDGFQVRELIGKLEEMIACCDGGRHYEMDRKVLEELESRMTEETERARERKTKKEKQTGKSQQEKLLPVSELRIVLIGGRKVGKSSCGNTILNKDSFSANTQTTSCSEGRGKVFGHTVTVVDTPGCFHVTPNLHSNTAAILLIVNISSSFRDTHREALEKQLETGGNQMWSRTMVVFSYGDWLGDTSIEQRIESEGPSLQRLIERCGNRYHALDNKHWGDGAQVRELMELVEEMLIGGRRADLYRGDTMWKSVSEDKLSNRQLLSCDLLKPAASTARPSSNCSEVSDARVVALPVRRSRRHTGFTFTSYLTSALRWQTFDLPVHLQAPHSQLRLTAENNAFLPRHQMMLLISCLSQPEMLPQDEVFGINSLWHPVLRERTLLRLCESGDLQGFIDQWGQSNLEDLEAFIDEYFEMVWEQTRGAFQTSEPASELNAVGLPDEEEELLLSIDKKLSKLELLEEIKSDLTELKQSLDRSWKAIEELRDKTKTNTRDSL